MTTAAIAVTDLVVQYPRQRGWRALFGRDLGKRVLDHLTLTVDRGEIFGLLGPNGAGKTTLIKVLATLTTPISGRAEVAGLDVGTHSREVRRRLGVVYGDERAFYWRLSALENLIFYASLYGMSPRDGRKRAMALLELVGLAHASEARMQHFSSGMRQRVSIARGLLHDPDILIMDEPTRTLDPVGSDELRRLIKERVAGNDRCVLIATNIMAEAEYLCDRLAFIKDGRLQQTGSVDQLRALLESEEVHELTVSGLSPHALAGLGRTCGVRSIEVAPGPEGRYMARLSVEHGSEAVPLMVRRVVECGGNVWSCTRRELSLDEMFTLMARAVEPSNPVGGRS